MESVIIDSFDMKGRVSIEYGQIGVVICLAAGSFTEAPQQGQAILLVRPDGWMAPLRMGEVKTAGNDGFTIFLPHLTKQDVPVGTRARWGTEFWPNESELKTEQSSLVRA